MLKLLLAFALVFLGPSAGAQGYPNKAIKFVVPYPPGGPLDTIVALPDG